MANVKFAVRRMDEDSPQTINVTFRFGRNDKLMYATPLKVEPIFWDADRQKVKNSKYCPYADEVNAALVAISSKLETFIADSAREGRTVTKDRLKEVLDRHFGKGTSRATTLHEARPSPIRLNASTRVPMNI